MARVFSLPPSPVSFDNAAKVWQLKAGSTETATITIPVGYVQVGSQLEYTMFVEIFDGNDILVMHGATEVGVVTAAGDPNGSQTATHSGQEITLVSEGPCHHVISSFTFDVAPA